jgi:hypothetical protein
MDGPRTQICDRKQGHVDAQNVLKKTVALLFRRFLHLLTCTPVVSKPF